MKRHTAGSGPRVGAEAYFVDPPVLNDRFENIDGVGYMSDISTDPSSFRDYTTSSESCVDLTTTKFSLHFQSPTCVTWNI